MGWKKYDEAVAEAVKADLLAGKSVRVIAKERGVSTGYVTERSKELPGREPRPVPDADRVREAVNRVLKELGLGQPARPEAVEAPPVKIPVEPRSRVVDVTGKRYERIAFLSDLHHPFQDDAAIDCALGVLRDYRPQLVVLAGDYFDCYSISSHDREPGRADFLQDEFDGARETHRKIEDTIGGADVVWGDGNHEERINRLQAANSGLFKLRALELHKAAELPARWMYYRNQTRFKAGPLTMLHGDLKGRGTSSMHAASGMLRKLRTSCIFGHLHRFQSFHETSDDGTVRGGFANGHLCDVSKAHYITNPDWQQGFSTIDFDWSLGIFSVTPHLIVRGSHRWAGKTYGPGRRIISPPA